MWNELKSPEGSSCLSNAITFTASETKKKKKKKKEKGQAQTPSTSGKSSSPRVKIAQTTKGPWKMNCVQATDTGAECTKAIAGR